MLERSYQVGAVRSSFMAMEASDLSRVAVAAQCLDGQWVPRSLLKRIMESGLNRRQIADGLEKTIRAEYIRALVNARQVIINRAFIKNNPIVYRDFVRKDEDGSRNREVFKQFLGSGVIAPFFFKEATPIDDADFQTDDGGTSAWREICQEVAPRCLRLSWDDQANQALTREQLAGKFHDFAKTATKLGSAPLGELRPPGEPTPSPAEGAAFYKRLYEAAQFALELEFKGGLGEDGRPRTLTTRQQIYERFVSTDGSNIPDGHYDREKPFSAELKLLFDLVYNINLPDALGVHALTPIDTPARNVLLGWELAKGDEISADDLFKLVSRTNFAILQGGLNFHSFYDLELEDVQKLRTTVEWETYLQRVEDLITRPLQFEEGQDKIALAYQDYFRVLSEIGRIRSKRDAEQKERAWKPYIQLVVDVVSPLAGKWASARLSVATGIEEGPAHTFVGDLVETVTKEALPVVVRMIIRGAYQASELPDLGTSFIIMRGKMKDASKQWRQLKQMIEKGAGFHERPAEGASSSATINDSGGQ